MQVKNENINDSLNKKNKINESEDLREFKHNEYNANDDLNKKSGSLNESKPISVTDSDLYDKNEILTEQRNFMNKLWDL